MKLCVICASNHAIIREAYEFPEILCWFCLRWAAKIIDPPEVTTDEQQMGREIYRASETRRTVV